jgi:hypothetical protein
VKALGGAPAVSPGENRQRDVDAGDPAGVASQDHGDAPQTRAQLEHTAGFLALAEARPEFQVVAARRFELVERQDPLVIRGNRLG